MSRCGVFACLNMLRGQFAAGGCAVGFFNVRFQRLGVAAADSGPVHLPEAECQGIIGHLVVKFRI